MRLITKVKLCGRKLKEGAFILEFAMTSKRGGFENFIIMLVKFPLF
jgi:hypothetical protein